MIASTGMIANTGISTNTGIAAIAGAGFAFASLGAYAQTMRQQRWASLVVRVVAAAAWVTLAGYLGVAVGRQGVVAALQTNFNASILMVLLIGLMAGCVHLSAKLRGLDGFLLIVAAVLSWAAMSLPDQPPAELSRRPWFISHGLAFAASAVCFAAGGAAGVGYLLVSRMLRRHRTAAMIGTVASLESLERFGRWMWLIGFPLFTYGILTGFCGIAHRQDLRQTTWYLDPTLIASLVAWGIYAYLCVASLYGPTLRARRAAVLSTYGLGLVLVAYVIREFSWLHH